MSYTNDIIVDLKATKPHLTKMKDRDAVDAAIGLIKQLKQEKDELERLVKRTSDARDLALREAEK